jgi:hypothetical protein
MQRLVIMFILLRGCFFTAAQTITASPGWSQSVPANTITEAGNNYTSPITSATNQTLVSFSLPSGLFGTTYTVSIHKIDATWHTNLSLWAQRTGTGTGGGLFATGTIAGGTSYIQLTNSPQVFFSGATGILSSGRSNIPIQYQVQGVSVLLPVRTYTTTVVYTVSE